MFLVNKMLMLKFKPKLAYVLLTAEGGDGGGVSAAADRRQSCARITLRTPRRHDESELMGWLTRREQKRRSGRLHATKTGQEVSY